MLVNLKAFLTVEERQLFYHGVWDRKLNILLLESEKREQVGGKEDIRLIDEGFCELYLAVGKVV